MKAIKCEMHSIPVLGCKLRNSRNHFEISLIFKGLNRAEEVTRLQRFRDRRPPLDPLQRAIIDMIAHPGRACHPCVATESSTLNPIIILRHVFLFGVHGTLADYKNRSAIVSFMACRVFKIDGVTCSWRIS